MNEYIPGLLIFLGLVGLIVGISLYLTRPKPKPQLVTSTSLGDTHVCVSQIKEQVQALPTHHKEFCKAIKNGLTSQCTHLQIIMTDEAGSSPVYFNYKGGRYVPSGDLLCKFKGMDMIAFRIREEGKAFTDEEWVTLSS